MAKKHELRIAHNSAREDCYMAMIEWPVNGDHPKWYFLARMFGYDDWFVFIDDGTWEQVEIMKKLSGPHSWAIYRALVLNGTLKEVFP